MEKRMTIKKVLTISTLTLCGLSLGPATLSHAETSKFKQLLQADSPMPPPVPIKKPGTGLTLVTSAPAAIQIADSPMPPPVPIKKPGTVLTLVTSAPAAIQIADSPMPPPVPINKPGGTTAV
jgi:hypothetical protein